MAQLGEHEDIVLYHRQGVESTKLRASPAAVTAFTINLGNSYEDLSLRFPLWLEVEMRIGILHVAIEEKHFTMKCHDACEAGADRRLAGPAFATGHG
jgi:hypothetical protein